MRLRTSLVSVSIFLLLHLGFSVSIGVQCYSSSLCRFHHIGCAPNRTVLNNGFPKADSSHSSNAYIIVDNSPQTADLTEPNTIANFQRHGRVGGHRKGILFKNNETSPNCILLRNAADDVLRELVLMQDTIQKYSTFVEVLESFSSERILLYGIDFENLLRWMVKWLILFEVTRLFLDMCISCSTSKRQNALALSAKKPSTPKFWFYLFTHYCHKIQQRERRLDFCLYIAQFVPFCFYIIALYLAIYTLQKQYVTLSIFSMSTSIFLGDSSLLPSFLVSIFGTTLWLIKDSIGKFFYWTPHNEFLACELINPVEHNGIHWN